MQGIIAGILLALGIITTQGKIPDFGAEDIMASFSFDVLKDTKVVWRSCWTANAFYNAQTNEVLLCSDYYEEMKNHLTPEEAKGAMRFTLAHELTHALVFQGNIPVAGGQEEAADELASIVEIMEGREKDLLAKAKYWEALIEVYDPTDIHPELKHRAYALRCLVDGYHERAGKSGDCILRWRMAVWSWLKLLENIK